MFTKSQESSPIYKGTFQRNKIPASVLRSRAILFSSKIVSSHNFARKFFFYLCRLGNKIFVKCKSTACDMAVSLLSTKFQLIAIMWDLLFLPNNHNAF